MEKKYIIMVLILVVLPNVILVYGHIKHCIFMVYVHFINRQQTPDFVVNDKEYKVIINDRRRKTIIDVFFALFYVVALITFTYILITVYIL